MKTQNPWMGRARGSAGNMTSSKVYDKNVMRAKAFEVNNPKTAAQTNERNFFAEAQSVCQTVSEEQLRSLFGVKPKSKSRRNALLSQLLEAFSINNGVKEFDFSKLYAIGNGQKVTTPIENIVDSSTDGRVYSMSMFGSNANNESNVILVFFDTDNNQISLFNSQATLAQLEDDTLNGCLGDMPIANGYVYATIEEKGVNVEDKNFGTFAIKTRAV